MVVVEGPESLQCRLLQAMPARPFAVVVVALPNDKRPGRRRAARKRRERTLSGPSKQQYLMTGD